MANNEELEIDIEEVKENVAYVTSKEILISSVDDALDLMGTVKYDCDCTKIVIHKENISEKFFDLKTGLLGEVLQKYTNYNIFLGVVGKFDKYNSKSLADFIYESNKTGQFIFKSSLDEVLKIF